MSHLRPTPLLAILVAALALAGCNGPGTGTPTTGTPVTTTSPVVGTARSDDFEAAAVGGLPSGWEVAMGNWSVVENASAPKGSKVLFSDETPLGETIIIDAGAGEWSDLEASVWINVLGGLQGQAGGIVFRYEDAQNYYVVRYNENELSWNLFRTIDGDREKFGGTNASEGFAGGLNKWFDLKLEARGDHIVVKSGNLTVIDYTEERDDAPRSGKVGLWTRYDSRTQFDDFRVAAS